MESLKANVKPTKTYFIFKIKNMKKRYIILLSKKKKKEIHYSTLPQGLNIKSSLLWC